MSQSQNQSSSTTDINENLVREVKQKEEMRFLGVSNNNAVIAFRQRNPALQKGKVEPDIPLDTKKKAMQYLQQKADINIDPQEWTIGYAIAYGRIKL